MIKVIRRKGEEEGRAEGRRNERKKRKKIGRKERDRNLPVYEILKAVLSGWVPVLMQVPVFLKIGTGTVPISPLVDFNSFLFLSGQTLQ
jgi:hypothetical protein